VLGPKLAEIELLSPWLTPQDIAVVEKFGQHSTPKLPGFIRGKQQYRLLARVTNREAYTKSHDTAFIVSDLLHSTHACMTADCMYSYVLTLHANSDAA
jgi:hypothetical protein